VRRLLPLLLVPLVLLAACGNEDPDSTNPDKTTSEPVRTGEVPAVSGAFGEAPTVDIPDSEPGNQLVSTVVEEGDGRETAANDVVVVDYAAWTWHAGDSSPDPSTTPKLNDDGSFDSTFERGMPQSFPLSTGSLLKGMYDGLLGKKVGSRVLVVIPPEQGFGEDGSQELGVGPDDSIVFVFDLLDDFTADAAASGTPVDVSDPSVPAVEDGDNGPTVTIPEGVDAPSDLVTQVLVQGDGAEVQTGQLLMVQYRGVIWRDGSEFDSSWKRGQPTSFPIGTGGVISGWDKGLVGQKVGSRVILVVPPAEGYGENGNSQAGIEGTDTLVFVVDILGAYGNPT
jgi:FKBP-type peptidyl-prolyl cis-trans isomerase